MPHFDYTINVPTLFLGIGILVKSWVFLNRLEYKINTMWVQFLLDHPDYDRREEMRVKL